MDISVITSKDEDFDVRLYYRLERVDRSLECFITSYGVSATITTQRQQPWPLQIMFWVCKVYSLVICSGAVLEASAVLPTRSSVAALFCLVFTWNIFSQPSTFNLCMSLDLRWVSCRHQINGSYFYNPFCQSVSFCSGVYTTYNNE